MKFRNVYTGVTVEAGPGPMSDGTWLLGPHMEYLPDGTERWNGWRTMVLRPGVWEPVEDEIEGRARG